MDRRVKYKRLVQKDFNKRGKSILPIYKPPPRVRKKDEPLINVKEKVIDRLPTKRCQNSDDVIPVTFKCDRHVTETFRMNCLARDKSPGATLSKLMKEFNDEMLKRDLRGL